MSSPAPCHNFTICLYGMVHASLHGKVHDGMLHDGMVQASLHGKVHDGMLHDGMVHDGMVHDRMVHDGMVHVSPGVLAAVCDLPPAIHGPA
jgi:hypothetical protein